MSQFRVSFVGEVEPLVRVADPTENRLVPLQPIDTSDSIPDNIAIWQEYTKQGNQLMKLALAQPRDSQFEQAQSGYDRAMVVAKKMWAQAQAQNSHPETIHIYTISCHNLADYYEAVNRNRQAEDLLLDAFSRTLSTMQDPQFAADFQMEAYRSLHMVLHQVVDFYDRHQNPNAGTPIVLQAGRQARQFLDRLNESPD